MLHWFAKVVGLNMVASLFGVRVVHGAQYARTLEVCDQRQNYQCCSDIGQ